MDESNSLDNLLATTELPVTPNAASELTVEQQTSNIEAKAEIMAQATTQVPEKTLSLSQRLAKEKRTSAFDWLTVYLWKDNDFFHAYNQSAYIVVNQLYTGEIKEQNNNRPLKVAKYRTSEGNYILAGFPVRSLNKYIATTNLQRVIEDCVEIAVPASIIDKSIDDLNKEYESWTKTLTDINLCKFQTKKKEPQQQYRYQGPSGEVPNQADLQSNSPGPKATVVQESSIDPMAQAEPLQNSKPVTTTYTKKPYSTNYWGNYHPQNQNSYGNNSWGNSWGNGYSNSSYSNYQNGYSNYQKPTWKFASYWNKENNSGQQSGYSQTNYSPQVNSQQQPVYPQNTYQQVPTQQIQQIQQYTMFDLIRDIIRFQPEMTSPTEAMNFLIGLKQKVNRFLI